MEYMQEDHVTADEVASMILCCECGTPIESNPANMCVACLRTRVDITEGIPKQAQLYFCKGCERYLQPPATWVACTLESRELLAVCLKRLKGLVKVHLVDAGFIWTEPHSKRVKVKLTIQKEVVGSAILQQVFVVEYVVHHQMCNECHRREAADFWRAVVQVRQKSSHKKTFFYLEQLLLKHRAHTHATRIKETSDGIDFFFPTKQNARKLVEFLSTVVPCKQKTSQELVSHDIHNNTFQYKHTFSVEIVPICKNDIVCLPLKLSRSLGNIGQIVVCNRVTTSVQFINPQTLQVADMSSTVYWRAPFLPLCHYRQLQEFYVLHIEELPRSSGATHKDKNLLCDAWVAPVHEVGVVELLCRTHLGHLLSAGDLVWGFHLGTANCNDTNLDLMKQGQKPTVVLVKKSYGDKKKRHRLRNWRLQQIDREMEATNEEEYTADYTEFLEDLEEDKDYRSNVNIYHDQQLVVGVADEESSDFPQIGLEEMLGALSIQEVPPMVPVVPTVMDQDVPMTD